MSLQYTVAVKYEIILEGYPMKKIIALLLSVLMILGMAACASNSSTPAATTTDTTADTTQSAIPRNSVQPPAMKLA